MKAYWNIHAYREGSVTRMPLATKVLEDKSTLFIMQKPDYATMDIPWAPLAGLVSIFALQPRKDFIDAAKSLSLVNNEGGVEVIREIFPTRSTNSNYADADDSHTALLLLVQVSLKFWVNSEKILPVIVQEARKKFVKRRSTTHTILEAGGFKVTLITGEKISRVYFHKKRIPEGITVFKGQKGFHSKLIELFLKLDRVPSRQIQDYASPDLPITYQIGTHIKNPARPVGFPTLTTGTVLVCGSNKTETISVVQQLINGIRKTGTTRQIFVIDTHNELNGIINYFQAHPRRDIPLQMFQLGTNIHLNLCDVIVPTSPSGEKQEIEAQAAWKSHLISQLLLSSLNTSEYLTARYAVPLESQIRKTAKKNHLFTLRDVSLSFGGVNESAVEENSEDNMMYADMMAIEAIVGVLEQFRSFPEVNYPSFTGHYSNTLVRENTMTFFQFGAQPPLIRRATVGFLLHYLSQSMRAGCVVLTHTPEFLAEQAEYKRDRKIGSSSIMDACNAITSHNILILSSHQLQQLAMNMDTFDDIRNTVYLKMANDQDRKLVMTRHELEIGRQTKSSTYKQQQSLGIAEGEGLLFREDAPQNVGFHFKLNQRLPVDLKPVTVLKTKQRGSETLGLTPMKYEILMKLLKLLINQPCQTDEILGILESTKQGELSLSQLKSLGLFTTETDRGATYWVITEKGREYYAKQYEFVNSMPAPLTIEEVGRAHQELKRLESLYDITSSHRERVDTNSRVKTLIGGLVNFLRHLRVTSIPWMRIAEYHDLVMIDSLEWQGFRNLFDLAHTMVNNLLLEITQLQKQHSSEEIEQNLQASSITPQAKKKDLNDFLPDDNLTYLQQLSRELGLDPYPMTGIVDLYYTLHTQGRSLFDELERRKGKNDSKDNN
ncbi:MAG: hypothetical protein ACFFDT_18085 [Candidatus Hodarchaeota archaeon]